MACTDLFWHHFYEGAGVMLGAVLPLLLGCGAMMWAILLLQYRHEAAMQEARMRHEEAMQEAMMREYQGRDSHDRVIQGGQG